MDINQVAKMIEWLDEERRNDKQTIATLEERLAQQSETISTLQKRVNSVESDQSMITRWHPSRFLRGRVICGKNAYRNAPIAWNQQKPAA